MTEALRRAIKLREWTRVACDTSDIEEVCRLNRLADKAYDKLTKEERAGYSAWVWTGPGGTAALKACKELSRGLRRRPRR